MDTMATTTETATIATTTGPDRTIEGAQTVGSVSGAAPAVEAVEVAVAVEAGVAEAAAEAAAADVAAVDLVTQKGS